MAGLPASNEQTVRLSIVRSAIKSGIQAVVIGRL